MNQPSLENLIQSNPENSRALKFLELDNKKELYLVPYAEGSNYWHEGLESFLKTNVPVELKYILDGTGIFVIPGTGEIIAFQFGRFDSCFKILHPHLYRHRFRHIRMGLLRNMKLLSACKVSLGYFSNVWGDKNTVVDVRSLGSNWALGIYFVDGIQHHVSEYYHKQIQ